ncbi:MAG: isoaspartyl peptidase/L-asparaginase [Chloroflexota bacterium]
MSPPSLIVHGGAWSIPKTEVEDHVNGCRVAAQAGWDVLTKGGSALDTVEAAVRVLEDDPTYDAGRGSVLNADGDIEMDAIIMDGTTLNTGAVAAIQRVQHPITVARLVMERSEHNLLVGTGAEAFARRMGVPVCPQVNLITERELERWQMAQKSGHEPTRKEFTHDTVGAVARDAKGHLAVATSTGGTFNKLPGRVGDSPLIGSGAYADDLCGAASATGWGESLMKIVISKSACDLIANGLTAQEAADAAIKRLADRVNGHGGIIVIDAQGSAGYARNTPGMAYAYVTAEGNIIAGC